VRYFFDQGGAARHGRDNTRWFSQEGVVASSSNGSNEQQELCYVEVLLRKKREGKERERKRKEKEKREARPCWPKENGPQGKMSWAAHERIKRAGVQFFSFYFLLFS
jgi:hypothetical protein